ncbi:MAG: hypothetical protein R3D01_03140 [Hyphomicrobiales bacterium]
MSIKAELGILSLVDPDNRRAVDFDLRRQLVDGDARETRPSFSPIGAAARSSSMILKALELRAEQPSLFTTGNYLPLALGGKHAATSRFFYAAMRRLRRSRSCRSVRIRFSKAASNRMFRPQYGMTRM